VERLLLRAAFGRVAVEGFVIVIVDPFEERLAGGWRHRA
jgi:hypothetical protein